MTPPCVVPTFRPYTVENLEFGGFYASSCESRVKLRMPVAQLMHPLSTHRLMTYLPFRFRALRAA